MFISHVIQYHTTHTTTAERRAKNSAGAAALVYPFLLAHSHTVKIDSSSFTLSMHELLPNFTGRTLLVFL